MANSLNQNLERGQAVVLNNDEVVYCKGGFGMCSFTMGAALFVEDTKGKKFRVSGYDIKRLVKNNE